MAHLKSRKLLFVINHIDWFWSHRLPLAKGAQAEGWDVSVAVTGAQDDADLAPQHFRGYELPTPEHGFAPLTVFKIIRRIHEVIKEEKPELLHAITLKYAFLAGLVARFHKDLRVVHTLAGLGYLFSGEGAKPKILRMLIGPFLKLALKADNIQLIFQNPDDMALMLKRGFARKDQCRLIPGSGVDLKEFPLKPLPKGVKPVVLMPTRLVREKGIAVFIEAANIFAKKGIEARFQIAGGVTTNNPSAISKTEIEGMIAGTHVEWLGKVSDMPALYQSASLICYPSYYGEGVPKVLLEAAATGRPIITTDHPGCREVVRNGENGLLVPVKNAQATANAIMALLEKPAIMDEMGVASHRLVQSEFAVESIVERTLAVYKNF